MTPTFHTEVPTVPGAYWTNYQLRFLGSWGWRTHDDEQSDLQGVLWFYGPLPEAMPVVPEEPCGENCEYCRNNPVIED